MMNEREAIRSRIIGDNAVVAMLDDYAGAPAVFAPRRPDAYDYGVDPAVIIRPPTSLDDESTFGTGGKGARSTVLVQVVVYAQLPQNSTDDSRVDQAAKAIRQLFRGKGFVGADGLTYQALVSGPIAAPTDADNIVGRLLQIRLNVGG